MTNSLPTQASPTSAGALLRLIREEVAVTRADLARATGLENGGDPSKAARIAKLCHRAGGKEKHGKEKLLPLEEPEMERDPLEMWKAGRDPLFG